MKYGAEFAQAGKEDTADISNILAPALAHLLGDVAGKDVLDLGCGSGRFSRQFAREGARVVGVDKHAGQLSRAISEEKIDHLNIDYRLRAAGDFQLEANRYDIALLMFVILDIPSAAEVINIIAAAAAAIKTGGVLVIGDLHPHNLGRRNDFEDCQLSDGKTYFDNAAIFRSAARTNSGDIVIFDPNFHYRLDFILNTIAEQGLQFRQMIEPEYIADFPTHILVCAAK
jgi:SAM-dependent methyltransferase